MSFIEFLFEKKITTGTYGCFKFDEESQKRLKDFCLNHRIPKSLESSKFHITFMYSRVKVKFDGLGDLKYKIRLDHSNFEWALFGDEKECLVLKVKHRFLQERFDAAMKAGATYDFKTYMPHVTLSYDIPKDFDLSALPLPDFELYLSNEHVKELNG